MKTSFFHCTNVYACTHDKVIRRFYACLMFMNKNEDTKNDINVFETRIYKLVLGKFYLLKIGDLCHSHDCDLQYLQVTTYNIVCTLIMKSVHVNPFFIKGKNCILKEWAHVWKISQSAMNLIMFEPMTHSLALNLTSLLEII